MPYEDFKVSFENQNIILQRTVNCTVKDHEMNYSYNPSLLASGSKENMLGFATGSADFMPYATTIGFYNDSNDLLLVGKFAQPVPIPSNTDTNFIIRMDI